MIVQCEKCQTKFRVDDKKVGPKGVKLRCAKCQHVFTVSAAPASAQESEKELPLASAAEFLAPPKRADAHASGSSELDSLADVLFGTPDPPAAAAAAATPSTSHEKIGLAKIELSKMAVPAGSPFPAPESTAPETKLDARPRDGTPLPRPAPPKIPSNRPYYPIRIEKLSLSQRTSRLLVVGGTMMFGIFLSLASMKIYPTPSSIEFLWQYGRLPKSLNPEVMKYEGHVVRKEGAKQVFQVVGELVNPSERSVPKVSLRLEVFSTTGEFLARSQIDCCERPLIPRGKSPFLIEVEMPRSPVGSYKVSVDGSSS